MGFSVSRHAGRQAHHALRERYIAYRQVTVVLPARSMNVISNQGFAAGPVVIHTSVNTMLDRAANFAMATSSPCNFSAFIAGPIEQGRSYAVIVTFALVKQY